MVDMKDGKAAMEALDSRELLLKGRRLIVDEAHARPDQVDRRRIHRTSWPQVTERLFLAGLQNWATEATVRALFQNHGLNPVDVYLPRDRVNGHVKGYAFVEMGSADEAARAIGALHGSLLEGSSLSVRPADPRPASSTRGMPVMTQTQIT
jgi:cold-inducible RNA-binding protein